MQTSCDTCANYEYDDDEEYYTCAINLDEDEMYRFLSGSKFECPYYTNGDEYAVVRHQMQKIKETQMTENRLQQYTVAGFLI